MCFLPGLTKREAVPKKRQSLLKLVGNYRHGQEDPVDDRVDGAGVYASRFAEMFSSLLPISDRS